MRQRSLTCVILATIGLLVLGVSHARAVQYLGQTTWSVHITQSEKGPVDKTFTVTGSITLLGGNYYLMQGYVVPPGDFPFVMSGSGVLTGGTLYLSLAESQPHTGSTWRDSGVMHIEMNANLDGTVYDIGNDFDTSTAGTTPVFDHRYSAGTVTRTGPAIILTPGAGAANMLLLD